MVEQSLKDSILESNDLQMEEVKVKEWGVTFFIRPLTLEERIKWEESIDLKDPALSGLTLLVYSTCKEDGTAIFSMEDIPKLRKKSGSAMVRLLRIARRVSKMRDSDIKEEIKNSEDPSQG